MSGNIYTILGGNRKVSWGSSSSSSSCESSPIAKAQRGKRGGRKPQSLRPDAEEFVVNATDNIAMPKPTMTGDELLAAMLEMFTLPEVNINILSLEGRVARKEAIEDRFAVIEQIKSLCLSTMETMNGEKSDIIRCTMRDQELVNQLCGPTASAKAKPTQAKPTRTMADVAMQGRTAPASTPAPMVAGRTSYSNPGPIRVRKFTCTKPAEFDIQVTMSDYNGTDGQTVPIKVKFGNENMNMRYVCTNPKHEKNPPASCTFAHLGGVLNVNRTDANYAPALDCIRNVPGLDVDEIKACMKDIKVRRLPGGRLFVPTKDLPIEDMRSVNEENVNEVLKWFYYCALWSELNEPGKYKWTEILGTA